jgi:hypothetical protein
VTSAPFSELERRTFYLETLGDANEGPMLHEAYWWARTRFPLASDEARIRLTERTLLTLVDRGLVEVFPFHAEHALERANARATILSDVWRTDPLGDQYEMAATPLGEETASRVPEAVWRKLRGRRYDELEGDWPEGVPTP